ncbi:cache domain-containing sensor histidine kinase [Paenibacillus rigui]|uniref:cache domain-containing sensor histidine kinase n=1 Tax=Paenibacillus rigui TaxID=554312 RepID=UPI001FEC3554|nr:sensor histidine kinase [Paenibacillus rigui]
MGKFNISRWRNSIFAKFTFSFILIGLIPLLVISYISLSTFSKYMERYTVNNFEQMILFASNNMTDMYNKYNNISKLMYSYGILGKYGQLGEAIAAQVDMKDGRLESTVDDFLRTVLYTDRYLENVFFVFPDGTFQRLTKDSKVFDYRYHYPDPAWEAQLKQNRQALAFFPTHPEQYHVGVNSQVMTFGRNLTNVLGTTALDGPVVGTLYMDVSLSAFDEVFQRIVLNANDIVYVVDAKGTVLYSNKRELIGKAYVPIASEEYLHIRQDAAENGWTIIGEVYKEEMFQRITQIMGMLLIVTVICAVSLMLVALWFSNRFSGPIRSITKQMSKVESGNFNSYVAVQSADEIGLLARGFNKMVERLQNYIDEVYVAQIKQKQAELNALKSQIRPHYLYNTLEVIRMSAVANDDHEVGEMILSLSHQLKYVLDSGVETVKLLEEKANIDQYFRLMEFRYGEHRLALDFRFDAEVLQYKVPKLSIQPIVENAIYHGIMPKSGKGTIRITAEKLADDKLCITIDDDGVGMSEEALERVRHKLTGSPVSESSGGIGIKNVHERIAALYGAPYGIEMNSSLHIGTSVRMMIPIVKEVSGDA